MVLILCECGHYFNKYGNILLGEPRSEDGQKDGLCGFKCPHCGKQYFENEVTRKLTRIINGEIEHEDLIL